MGVTDKLMQQYLSDNARFADLINGYLGVNLITPSDLAEKDSHIVSKAGNEINQMVIGKFRDIIRKTAIGMDFVIIGIENQLEINYAMPIRAMIYDALNYEQQLKQIIKDNKRQSGLSSAEFLGGFRKIDKLVPVFTIVVYYGQKPWDGATDLHGVVNLEHLPREVRQLICNYPINLFQINSFEGIEYFQKDLRLVCCLVGRYGKSAE